MSSASSGTITTKMLIVIVVVAALVGTSSSLATVYLTGERHTGVAPQTRNFYLFTDTINFTESKLGIPHDIFNPDRITVNQGDTVIIHYYNLEDVAEDHTFTLEAPFWTQSSVTVQGAQWNDGIIIVHQNQEVNITFVANVAGVYTYLCTYHQPTMTGDLVVLLD